MRDLQINSKASTNIFGFLFILFFYFGCAELFTDACNRNKLIILPLHSYKWNWICKAGRRKDLPGFAETSRDSADAGRSSCLQASFLLLALFFFCCSVSPSLPPARRLLPCFPLRLSVWVEGGSWCNRSRG
jgi:hypothetical protein